MKSNPAGARLTAAEADRLVRSRCSPSRWATLEQSRPLGEGLLGFEVKEPSQSKAAFAGARSS